jgi:hypothetical protein
MVPAGCLAPTAKEVSTALKWCRVSGVQLFSNLLCTKQPEASIRAVKKPGRSLLSRAAGKLERHNLFQIRKWNLSCTIAGAKKIQESGLSSIGLSQRIRKKSLLLRNASNLLECHIQRSSQTSIHGRAGAYAGEARSGHRDRITSNRNPA